MVPRDVVRHMRSTVSPCPAGGRGLGQLGAVLGAPRAPARAWMPSRPQDSQCGTVIDVNIDCAVKLIGTNCIVYPVNSKDLQHIWVSPPPASRRGALLPSRPSG